MNWKKRKRLTRLMHKHHTSSHAKYKHYVYEWCVVSACYGRPRYQLIKEWRDMSEDDQERLIAIAFRKYYLKKNDMDGVFMMDAIIKYCSHTNDLPTYVSDQISDKQYPELEDDWKQRLFAAIEERIMDPKFDYVPSYCVTPPDPFTTALMAGIHGELVDGEQT